MPTASRPNARSGLIKPATHANGNCVIAGGAVRSFLLVA